MAKTTLTNCIDDYIAYLSNKGVQKPYELIKPLYAVFKTKKAKGLYAMYILQNKEVKDAVLEYCDFLSTCWGTKVFYNKNDKIEALYKNQIKHFELNKNYFYKEAALFMCSHDSQVFMSSIHCNEKDQLNTLIYKPVDSKVYYHALLSQTLSELFANLDSNAKLALII